ncbi:MAG: TAXI family TRAP transporter solute-binding subunit [Ectothiorhodospiraceae bacterium]|nr:TAXI family TRAP transporter solute-binding subunit [Ectothiorhodospiraceae bacterium]
MKRLVIAALAALAVSASGLAHAQSFFRIVSGSAGGNYFPMAGVLANAISNPPGSRPCDKGGPCGVPGLIAIAQSANGSVANVNAIQSGTAESGLAQSDVAYWGYTATGVFEGKSKLDKLRFLASLYPEHIHIVLPKDSPVQKLEDLKGKRIGVGLPASGAQVGALLILNAVGLEKNVNFQAEELNTSQSAERIQDGQLDAFLTVTGAPSSGIAQLASVSGMRLLAIPKEVQDKVIAQAPFYFSSDIPAGAYDGQEQAVNTLAVGAQWLVSADQPEDLVYGITKALWNDTTKKLLKHHAKGKDVTLETALGGRGIPLHPGAERFYKEAGLIK